MMKVEISPQTYPYTIAVLSDSHIPTDQPDLPGSLIREITRIRPDLLLHAGDICRRSVLTRFEELCPVYAVRGNRDIRDWFGLPGRISFHIGAFDILLMHGEGSFPRYVAAKLYRVYLDLTGQYFVPPAGRVDGKTDGPVDICISGHTHVPWMEQKKQVLYLNPGASFDSCRAGTEYPHTYALLCLSAPDHLTAKIMSAGTSGSYSELYSSEYGR